MASTLKKLLAQLSSQDTYTPKTPEELEQEAQRRYETVYNQKRLAARETYEQNDSALARELAALQGTYDQRREETRAQNRQTYAQADRHSLSRGMQRSSYNSATLANIDLAGDAALGALSSEQAQREGDIARERTQLKQQFDRQLSQFDADQTADTLAYADQLAQREYDRARDADQLAMQLYEYQRELEKDAAEQARWQAEFNAKYGSSASGRKKTSSQSSSSAAANASVSAASGVRKGSRDLMY